VPRSATVLENEECKLQNGILGRIAAIGLFRAGFRRLARSAARYDRQTLRNVQGRHASESMQGGG
jgi:hypothetical protein